ncbi:MAG: hypothetical protein ACRCS9_11785 [Hyphomicrobium sp.]
MTEKLAKARRIERLLHQMHTLEELRLADINRAIEEKANDELRIVEHLSGGVVNDPRLLNAMSRRLQRTSGDIHDLNARLARQYQACQVLKRKQTFAEKRADTIGAALEREQEQAELAESIERAVVAALIKRPAR